jgi:hypothetical protein
VAPEQPPAQAVAEQPVNASLNEMLQRESLLDETQIAEPVQSNIQEAEQNNTE